MGADWMKHKLQALAVLLLVVGGFNWGILAFTGRDAVSSLFGKGSLVANGIFFAVAIAALAIAFYRDSYLPFLGPSIIPCSLLKEQVPEGANFSVSVTVNPSQKIIYWAAEPANSELAELQDWKHAYLGYKNAGVAVADDNGKATLKVRKPQPYTVPIMRELKPHIHYRTCGENGFIGRVETVTVDGKEYFENYVQDIEKGDDEEAHDFIQQTAYDTLTNSLMIQDGAPDEADGKRNAEI